MVTHLPQFEPIKPSDDGNFAKRVVQLA